LSGIYRQAANYAIPIEIVEAFINEALNPRPETFRAALDERLTKFVDGLNVNRAAYPHIAEFLSAVCVGENAEYAISVINDSGNNTIKRAFVEKFDESVIGAMGTAVAWTIENSIRTQGALRASIKDVSGSGDEYTVVFTINNQDHSSRWVREYGTWRIRTFGSVASGDNAAQAQATQQRQAQRAAAQNLRLESDLHIEVGYAYLFDKSPWAIYVAAEFSKQFGLKFTFAGADFWSIGGFYGFRWDIPVGGNFGLMPYVRAGIEYQHDQEYLDYRKTLDTSLMGPPTISMSGQAGIKVTTSYVPGLFLGVGFQYNIIGFHTFMGTGINNNKFKNPMEMALSVTVGYAF
jgi:hypothetical protein